MVLGSVPLHSPSNGGVLLAGDLYTVLDLAKVADSLLFILDPAEGWDDAGEYCLSCLFAQGLPTFGEQVRNIKGF